jgi:hypothetical protein
VGRVPLIPLVVAGYSTPRSLTCSASTKIRAFPYGCADSAAADGRLCSNVYEINSWLWQFGRGKPRLGGLTVKETTERRKATRDARLKRGWETRQHRMADKT